MEPRRCESWRGGGRSRHCALLRVSRIPGTERKRKALEFEFDPNYTHAKTRIQRLNNMLRVPMFDGFLMPSHSQDAETAAMYKQLLLRPSAMAYSDSLTEERAVFEMFSHLCSPLPEGCREYFSPATAFSANWMRHQRAMEVDAAEGRRRFLDRYEYPFLWETEEVTAALHDGWLHRGHDGEVDPDHCRKPSGPDPWPRLVLCSRSSSDSVGFSFSGDRPHRRLRRRRLRCSVVGLRISEESWAHKVVRETAVGNPPPGARGWRPQAHPRAHRVLRAYASPCPMIPRGVLMCPPLRTRVLLRS